MKLSKILILSLGMALCAAGGIGTALATISRTPASSSSSGNYDQAIYLYWDSESETSANLTPVTSLQVGTPVYRHLVVSPKSSKSVSGNVTVTFTLQVAANTESKTSVLTGLSVDVYAISAPAAETEEAIATAIGSSAAAITLTDQANDQVDSVSFAVSTSSAVHETVQHYGIKVSYSGAQKGADEVVCAELVMHQSFGA